MSSLSPKESAAEHLRHIEALIILRHSELLPFTDTIRDLIDDLNDLARRARLAREALESGAATATERLTLDVEALSPLVVAEALGLEGAVIAAVLPYEAGAFVIDVVRRLARSQQEARALAAIEA